MHDALVQTETDPRTSRRARGLRLKSIRQSLRLSRQAFADRFAISTYTLQNWETSKNGGLSAARAEDIVELLKLAGVKCSFEWLMYGMAPAPAFSDPILGEIFLEQPSNTVAESTRDESNELKMIADELNLLRNHYPRQVIDMLVPDDAMEPTYRKGDYVAGIKQSKHKIKQLIGENCIVITEQNEQLLRQLQESNIPGHYNLACINPNASTATPSLDNVTIKTAARIIWKRIKM